MKWPRWFCILTLLAVFLTKFPLGTALAAPGTPGSPEFGYGAILYPDTESSEKALKMAVGLKLDWVELPFDWSDSQPDPDHPARMDGFDLLVQSLAENGISILFSVHNVPEWALTITGPDPDMTAEIISFIAERYDETVQAIELFPGANNRRSWRAEVSPKAYFQVFQAVHERLTEQGHTIILVAAGLESFGQIIPKGSMKDTEYLAELYTLGAATLMPVISLGYADVTGNPYQIPSDQEMRVLRRFEEIRRVMVENHHETGSIWITRFCLPSGKISAADSEYQTMDAQSTWLTQAYLIVRSHLFIGVAFLPSLNSGGEGTTAEFPIALQDKSGLLHPFYSVFEELIGLNQIINVIPGRAKEDNFAKKRPLL